MNIPVLGRRLMRDGLRLAHPARSLEQCVRAAVCWLCHAQDSQNDGGVSLRYSLIKGWDASYPETTGYIIPTFLHYAQLTGDETLRARALQMAEWELSIQKPDGSFGGGAVNSGYDSFVFDTGQVIFGLVAAHRATGDRKFIDGAIKAGRWLVSVQHPSGMWDRFTFHGIPHVYYTRVAWALAELGAYIHDKLFTEAAERNVTWAIGRQRTNGWFEQAGFTSVAHAAPYTHTIAYTIEGVLEVGACLRHEHYIAAATRSAQALQRIMHREGCYLGTYSQDWTSNAGYSCLTGNAQIALIFGRLHHITGDASYLDSMRVANHFLCRHQEHLGGAETMGAIAGSWPVWGQYQRYAYPNWAAKFFIDSLLLEQCLDVQASPARSRETLIGVESAQQPGMAPR